MNKCRGRSIIVHAAQAKLYLRAALAWGYQIWAPLGPLVHPPSTNIHESVNANDDTFMTL